MELFAASNYGFSSDLPRSFSCQVPGPGSELDMSAKFCFVKKSILGRVAFADGKSAGGKKRGLCRIREIWERR